MVGAVIYFNWFDFKPFRRTSKVVLTFALRAMLFLFWSYQVIPQDESLIEVQFWLVHLSPRKNRKLSKSAERVSLCKTAAYECKLQLFNLPLSSDSCKYIFIVLFKCSCSLTQLCSWTKWCCIWSCIIEHCPFPWRLSCWSLGFDAR